MNKRFMAQNTPGSEYFALIVCGALFLCGCVAGTAFARFAGTDALSLFLSEYLSIAGNNVSRTFVSELWNTCKYHLAAAFFGFSVFGVLCVPALSAVRGFFLCFSISAIVRCFGGDGVFLALALFGANLFVALPCFFILSVRSFSASLCLLKYAAPGGTHVLSRPYGPVFFKTLITCFFALFCTALANSLLIVRLVAALAARLN